VLRTKVPDPFLNHAPICCIPEQQGRVGRRRATLLHPSHSFPGLLVALR
jgi:hypothetical protein